MPTLPEIAAELNRLALDFSTRELTRDEKMLLRNVRTMNDAIIRVQNSFKDGVSPETARAFDKVVEDLGKVLQEAEQDTLIDFGIW